MVISEVELEAEFLVDLNVGSAPLVNNDIMQVGMKSEIIAILENRYKSQLSALDGIDGELLSRLYEGAVAIGLSKEDAVSWLFAPMFSLGNLSPLTFVNSQSKLEQVLDVLGGIEHGSCV